MNLTRNQIIAIMLVVLGVLTTSTAQLTDLFGPQTTKYIVSAAGLFNTILSGVLAVFTGQGATVRDVQAMEGIDSIQVNARANSTLAALAVDPAQSKIEATPGAAQAVAKTAAEGA